MSFVRRKFSRIEGMSGPFHEPRRPHPIIDADTAKLHFDELESLLAHLEAARRRSWPFALLPGLLWAVLLLAASGFRVPTRELAILVPVALLIGVWDNVAYWLSWPLGSRTLTTFIVKDVPSYESILSEARSVHDAILGLREPERLALLGGLAQSHPRVFEAAVVSWTLVPESLKVELVADPPNKRFQLTRRSRRLD
mgnify:FL=1